MRCDFQDLSPPSIPLPPTPSSHFRSWADNCISLSSYFIEAILSLSVVAVVIVNIYSLGLNVQVISQTLMRIPRLSQCGCILAHPVLSDYVPRVCLFQTRLQILRRVLGQSEEAPRGHYSVLHLLCRHGTYYSADESKLGSSLLMGHVVSI